MEYVPSVSYSNFPDVSVIAVLQQFKGKSETSSYMRYAHTKGGVIKIFYYYLFISFYNIYFKPEDYRHQNLSLKKTKRALFDVFGPL